ncbi:hypothetical protein G5V57_09665 [Nordella sp. HKS 07]|uniref:hypothetical protein n=1 Tax=Nordella sp. HKS 07 TaxID=2712222 RepID=UPI0013E18CC3|nr:hypothetical protein [Nordella sp. HKS 07]QIG47961.1 hypothetical protein G5V57_09665 [Nordella sp. HKS 07]
MLPRTLRRTAFITLAAGLYLLAPVVARAQFAMCGERAPIVEGLKSKYNETRQAVGLIASSGVAELYVSEAGTWTMLVTLENGKSCIIAAGHSWDPSPSLAQGSGI